MIAKVAKRLAILAVLAGATGVGLLWHYRETLAAIDVEGALSRIAEFGPLPFFCVMAFAPSLWAPVSPFLLMAGALYDLPLALGGCAAALSFNMAFSWLLAGKLFRPLFERLVHRFGYSIPDLSHGSMVTVAVLLRITPGTPFPLQNYLLGLARMPFGWYMAISLPLNLVIAFSIILFGDALLKGNVGVAFIAVALFVVLGLVVRQLRTRLRSRELLEKTE